MRFQLAALIATSVIAVTASVFAIWPVVADAPWENNPTPIPTVNQAALLRCQGAIDLRQEASARVQGELDKQAEDRGEELLSIIEFTITLEEIRLGRPLTAAERRDLVLAGMEGAPALIGEREHVLAEEQIAQAEREIDRYC